MDGRRRRRCRITKPQKRIHGHYGFGREENQYHHFWPHNRYRGADRQTDGRHMEEDWKQKKRGGKRPGEEAPKGYTTAQYDQRIELEEISIILGELFGFRTSEEKLDDDAVRYLLVLLTVVRFFLLNFFFGTPFGPVCRSSSRRRRRRGAPLVTSAPISQHSDSSSSSVFSACRNKCGK